MSHLEDKPDPAQLREAQELIAELMIDRGNSVEVMASVWDLVYYARVLGIPEIGVKPLTMRRDPTPDGRSIVYLHMDDGSTIQHTPDSPNAQLNALWGGRAVVVDEPEQVANHVIYLLQSWGCNSAHVATFPDGRVIVDTGLHKFRGGLVLRKTMTYYEPAIQFDMETLVAWADEIEGPRV